MTKEELIVKLRALSQENGDCEVDHIDADELLLEFIGDDEVRQAFESIDKWYA